MTKETIRILVDISRDAAWSNGLIQIEPDNLYITTNNQDYLNENVLKNYDVLTICNHTQIKYTAEELKLIDKFVTKGGGLLLTTSTSRFERDIQKPITELGINEIASLFNTKFLPLHEGKGEYGTDANPLRGYTKENLRLTDYEIIDGLLIDDLKLSFCGILDVPEEGYVFLEHKETKEPIGACLLHGLGRVLLINTQLFKEENHLVACKFLDWLGINRISSKTNNQTLPVTIPIEEHVKEGANIKIYYNQFVSGSVDTCMTFAKKLVDGMFSKFPLTKNIVWNINLVPSCSHEYMSDLDDSLMTIGGCQNPSRLAYSLGVEVCSLLAYKTPFGMVTEILFDGYQFFFGIWGMKLLGFETEANEMLSEADRHFNENAEVEMSIDIARIYDQKSRKPIWIFNRLIEKYGEDLFVKLIEVLNEENVDIEKNMPRTTFSWIDSLIYHLSRAVGEDLFPWFVEIGTTVHPLPMLPNESDEFVKVVKEQLNEKIRNTKVETMDRLDAIYSLLELIDDSDHEISKLVAQLNAQDKYKRLIVAAKLIQFCDMRALKVLEELISETDDDGLVAMVLILLGRHSHELRFIEPLIKKAQHQDIRFKLETGYLLTKIDHPSADRFSFENLTNENGPSVISTEIKYDKDLHYYAIVNGYRIATCNVMVHSHHFPYNTHASGTYVRWVHTKPKYRQKGLSRYLFNASLSHELVQRNSCISLHTGVRNFAHGMYRDFGFVDGYLGSTFSKSLQYKISKKADGIEIRPYKPGDEVAMVSALNKFYADELNRAQRRGKRYRHSENRAMYLVEMNSELLGYVQVQCNVKTKNGLITEFCLIPPTDDSSNTREGFLEEVGVALLSTMHNELLSDDYKNIYWNPEGEEEKEYVRNVFHKSGYTSSEASWVWMFKIINLPVLLEELSPLLSKRLNENDGCKGWQGTINIKGMEHQVSLSIKEGRIQVSGEISKNIGICISTDDDTLTRFILGVITPYEAYLNNQLQISPTINSFIINLLGTLFPSKRKKH